MMGMPRNPESGDGWGGHLRVVTRDGEPVLQLRCPECQMWGDIDSDQAHGLVSVDHSDVCGYHDTKDWWGEAEAHTGRVPTALTQDWAHDPLTERES